MKTKSARPEFSDVEKTKHAQNNKNCKNCGLPIQQEYLKGIWEHIHEPNSYACKLAEPRKEKSIYKHNCKTHNYKLSKHSDAMICTKCNDVIHKRDFFTNRNVYWCRVDNMRFTNIEYHRKKYHIRTVAGKEHEIVMDYIDYSDVNNFEKPKVLKEDGKRLWSDSGHGCTMSIDYYTEKEKHQRFDVHIIDYGFISKSKFCKLTKHDPDFVNLAGNDKGLIRPENKDQIHVILHDRVIGRLSHEGKLIWSDPTIPKGLKDSMKNLLLKI